jgi:hypothetical protein
VRTEDMEDAKDTAEKPRPVATDCFRPRPT